MIASCDWSAPGADRFTGTPAAAVAHYTDIPAPIRAALIRRMERHQYDAQVRITRDAISGGFAPELKQMHFGSKGKVCDTVNRSAWKQTAVERGLVYCEGAHCLIVPSVCGNISRITRLPVEQELPPLDPKPGAGPAADTPRAPIVDSTPIPVQPPLTQGFAVPPPVSYYSPPSYGGGVGPVGVVPEPPTWALIAAGMVALIWRMR